MVAIAAKAEQCTFCHDQGKSYDLNVGHAAAHRVAISDAAVTTAGADTLITFNLKLDGVNDDTYLTPVTQGTPAAPVAYAFAANGTRTAIASYTVAPNGSGNYTVTLPGVAPAAGTRYMINLHGSMPEPIATVVADYQGAVRTVSDQACVNCHGDSVFPNGHHETYPQGVGACVVCHARADRFETNLGALAPGSRLMGYVHGIHNSHHMPGEVYKRNASTNQANWFSVTYPGNMTNCVSCHDTEGGLDAVLDKPVSWGTCMSCHANWDGFPKTQVGGAKEDHRGFNNTTTPAACATCHDGTIAFGKVRDVHNGKPTAEKPVFHYTERNGLLWDGKDQSIEAAKKIRMTITEVVASGSESELLVKWKAYDPTNGDALYNPCNTDINAGPVFFGLTANAPTGQAASNMSILRAYAQGNDWVNAGVGTSPGQPATPTTLAASNTTCADNIATTVSKVDKTSATKGIVGLQGKPQVKYSPTGATWSRIIQARVPSPTREYLVASGAEPAASDKRRQIVSIDKCLSCHEGTLYQHGGNRVDSIELCVMCHNPAANEQNNRVSMGVTPEEAYDGKAGETYDFRYMLHAIHSAGDTGAPLVYYRSNGIYAWGNEASLASLPYWPGTGSKTVYGSVPAGDNAAGTTKTHNAHAVTYPRSLKDCGACHINDSEKALPRQDTSVAVTYAAGGAPWSNQTDDLLLGPVTATCMSCHQSSDGYQQGMYRAHAYDFGWAPALFTDGRQILLDYVK